MHEKYGDIVRIGPNEVSIASPEAFHHVFVTKSSTFKKSDFYTSIQPGIGEKYAGLFNFTDHKQSMRERKDLQPMFSPANMKIYEKRYDEQLDTLISIIKDRRELDMFKYL